MAKRKEILATVVGLLVLAPILRAEMMPVFPLTIESRAPRHLSVPADAPSADLYSPFGGPTGADWHSLPAGLAPETDNEAELTYETEPVWVLSDGQNSFSLCLYALIGLGLCRSAPLVKKLSLGPIPDWYHNGGPFQMGHRYAIGPDLCAAPVYCFVQPDHPVRECRPQYARGTIASPLRESQFTFPLRAPRGPPFGSC
jgi:hypothetical protein